MKYFLPIPGPSRIASLATAAKSYVRSQEAAPQPFKDRKTLETEKKEAAKQKAIEAFKKSQAKRSKKSQNLGPTRKVLPDHNLSESESD